MTSFFAFTLFVWVELIGFDNAKPDFGVGDYLDRMAVKPQAISLLLDNDGLFLSHKEGLPADFAFPPNVAAYGGRPFNRERLAEIFDQTFALLEEAILLADRIFFMRPGEIVRDIHIDFDRPRNAEELAGNPRFGELRGELLRLFSLDVDKEVEYEA